MVSREVTVIREFVLHPTLLDKLNSCRIPSLALIKLHGRGWLAPAQATEVPQRCPCLPAAITPFQPLTYHTGLTAPLSSSQRPRNIWQRIRSKIFPVWFCSELREASSWREGTGALKDFSSAGLPLGAGFSCSPGRLLAGTLQPFRGWFPSETQLMPLTARNAGRCTAGWNTF